MAKINWHPEIRNLADLKPWDKNPRRLTEKGMADLTQSIRRLGLAQPIVINTDGLILGGHARYQVLLAEGETQAQCFVPDRPLNKDEIAETNIRLNANTAGEWDYDALANEWNTQDLEDWGL